MLFVSRSEHRSNFRILLASREPPFSRLRHPNRIEVLQEVVGVLPIPGANDLGWGDTTTLQPSLTERSPTASHSAWGKCFASRGDSSMASRRI